MISSCQQEQKTLLWFVVESNDKQRLWAFSLEDVLDNLCSFLILQSIQWWRAVGPFYVKFSYKTEGIQKAFQ